MKTNIELETSVTTSTPPHAAGEQPSPAPLYTLVADVLRKAIAQGTLPPGTVLLEGPISELLRCTRAPVRQALFSLAAERLISRFEGRGYVVGGVGHEPRRLTLTPSMLGLDQTVSPVRKTLAWEAIYNQVERALVTVSVFDRYQINEMQLAHHFHMGRDVLRSVLTRLEGLGIVEKDQRMRWWVTPLSEHRIRNLYELRLLLEPVALASAVRNAEPTALRTMYERTVDVQNRYPDVTRTELDELETDLHVKLLQRASNPELLASLRRTRCILTLSKHVLGEALPMPATDPFIAEHLEILDSASDSPNAAAACLRRHLENSLGKVILRAENVRCTSTAPVATYLTNRPRPSDAD